MLLFVDHIAEKQIIAPALNSVVGGPSKLYEGSRGLIQGAIDALVKRAIKSGDIRKRSRPLRPASSADRCFPCSVRSRLATKRHAGWWTSSSQVPAQSNRKCTGSGGRLLAQRKLVSQ